MRSGSQVFGCPSRDILAPMPRLDASSVRAYLARDWQRLRQNKREYWRNRLDRGGLAEAIRVTELLRDAHDQSDTHREEDLQTHARVAQAFAKTAPRRATARRAPRVRKTR